MGVRIILVLCIALYGCFANEASFDLLDSKVINFVGESSYQRNKNFINKIFASKADFYQNGNLDIYKILFTLQSNGLLKLKFEKPREFSAVFMSQTNPIFLLRAINQSLSYMGYSYWAMSEVVYENGVSRLKISLSTEHIINPITLLNELSKSGFVNIDVRINNSNEWEYLLSLTDSQMPNSIFLSKGNSINVSNVSGEYWIMLGEARGRLYISAQRSFNPRVVFFDKDLNILDIHTLYRSKDIRLDVIDNVKFVQIKDSISSLNLRGSIKISYK